MRIHVWFRCIHAWGNCGPSLLSDWVQSIFKFHLNYLTLFRSENDLLNLLSVCIILSDLLWFLTEELVFQKRLISPLLRREHPLEYLLPSCTRIFIIVNHIFEVLMNRVVFWGTNSLIFFSLQILFQLNIYKLVFLNIGIDNSYTI